MPEVSWLSCLCNTNKIYMFTCLLFLYKGLSIRFSYSGFYNNHLWIEVWHVTICGRQNRNIKPWLKKSKDIILHIVTELELGESWVRFSHLELGFFFSSFLLVLQILIFWMLRNNADAHISSLGYLWRHFVSCMNELKFINVVSFSLHTCLGGLLKAVETTFVETIGSPSSKYEHRHCCVTFKI